MPSVFHNRATQIAVDLNLESIRRNGAAPNDIVRDALFVLNHDAVTVHRAAGALADAGWPGPAAVLLRTLMDIQASSLAVLHHEPQALGAFKYLYSGYRKHSRDQRLDAGARAGMRERLRQRIESLPAELRSQLAEVFRDRDRAYWFSPRWRGPSELIETYGNAELKWVYMQYSAAAHGAYFGLRLYRENPDQLNINPEPRGRRGLVLDFTSCRLLLFVVQTRNAYERLGFDQRIEQLVSEIAVAVAAAPERLGVGENVIA